MWSSAHQHSEFAPVEYHIYTEDVLFHLHLKCPEQDLRHLAIYTTSPLRSLFHLFAAKDNVIQQLIALCV